VTEERQSARKLPRLSESVEEYLEAIYKVECEGERVGVTTLATHLGRSAPSVSQMIARLRDKFRQIREGAVVPLAPPPIIGLGTGGGYYDRALAFRRWRRHWHAPRLIGVGYAFQELPRLERAVHDVLMDAVVTEEGMIRCATG